jgi:hypothetical protein
LFEHILYSEYNIGIQALMSDMQESYSDMSPILKFIGICVIVIIIWVLVRSIDGREYFNASINPDIDLLRISNNYMDKNIDHYMTVTEFTDMEITVKNIIVNELIARARECSTMNGMEHDKLEKHQLTLICHNDTDEIIKSIILSVSNYIIDHIKNRYRININPYYVVNILYGHLDLDEAVLYPLMDGQLYTVHGIQYFTEPSVQKLVAENLHVQDVLHTILSYRGIVVVIDNDHIPGE